MRYLTFNEFNRLLQAHFNEMVKDIDCLYEVQIDNKDDFWNLYLDSFPAGTNPMYRKRREFDCSCCRHFIKSFGHVVSIKDNQVHTIWDFNTGDSMYQPVLDALSAYVKAHPIMDRFVTKERSFGTEISREYMDDKVNIYNHFFVSLPYKLIDRSSYTIDTVKGNYKSTKNVFQRSLTEITVDSVMTVLELITSNTLYRGAEWEAPLKEFLKYKKQFEMLHTDQQKDLFAWEQSGKVGVSISKIRNHSIGVLLVNISDGMDLDQAVTQYEKIVAPSNYKRPKAIFTQRMLDDAKKR